MSIDQGAPGEVPKGITGADAAMHSPKPPPVMPKTTGSNSTRGSGRPLAPPPRRRNMTPWLVAVLVLALAMIGGTMATAPYWAPRLLPYMQWGPSSETQAAMPPASPAMPPPPETGTPSSSAQTTDAAKPPEAMVPPDAEKNTGSATTAPEPQEAKLRQLGDDQRKLAMSIAVLNTRLEEIEKAVREASDEGHVARILLLANNQLQAAIDRAEPYSGELAVLTALAADDHAVASIIGKLGAHAKTGVKSRVTLLQDLADLQSATEEAPAETRSWWERAVDQTRHLVTVRRAVDPDHPDATPAGPDRTIAEAMADLRGGDLGGAIGRIRGLSGAAAKHTASWLQEAQARADVEQAGDDLQTLLIRRLSPQSPESAERPQP